MPEHGGRRHVSGFVTEAEAHIIAFALNAVAEGKRLGTVHDFNVIDYYTGPTEGVAP